MDAPDKPEVWVSASYYEELLKEVDHLKGQLAKAKHDNYVLTRRVAALEKTLAEAKLGGS